MMVALTVLAIIIIIVLFMCYIFINLLLLETTVEYYHGKGPWLALLFMKAGYRSLIRRQGRLYHTPKATDEKRPINPNTVYADHTERVLFKNCRIDKEKLRLYKEVCLFMEKIPVCYLETLFVHSVIILTTSSSFKLSPLGLIHIHQSVTFHQTLDDLYDEEFMLESRVKEYRTVRRGIEVDIILTVINKTGFCVWEGLMTLLSRNASIQKSSEVKKDVAESVQAEQKWVSSPITVPADLGIQYAKVSGDWNPHHLYPWSARLLGYRKPIAHGMWTLSTMIAAIQTDYQLEEYPVRIEAEFKQPMFLPGDAILKYSSSGKNKINFSVLETSTEKPHLIGTINYG